MILNYQQRQAMRNPRPEPAQTAVIGQAFEDGVTLIFPDGSGSRKRYKTAAGHSFSPGMRVKIRKISGTYLVEYPL